MKQQVEIIVPPEKIYEEVFFAISLQENWESDRKR